MFLLNDMIKCFEFFFRQKNEYRSCLYDLLHFIGCLVVYHRKNMNINILKNNTCRIRSDRPHEKAIQRVPDFWTMCSTVIRVSDPDLHWIRIFGVPGSGSAFLEVSRAGSGFSIGSVST